MFVIYVLFTIVLHSIKYVVFHSHTLLRICIYVVHPVVLMFGGCGNTGELATMVM